MPYRIVKEAKGVYLKWTGRIIGEELLKAVHEVNESPDFQMYHYVINDTLGCSGIDLSAMTMEDAIAGAIGAHVSNPRFVAAFVADDQCIFDAWSSIAKVADDYLRTAVFTDLEEARSWALSVKRD